jgi:maltooligosyltrehalose trehalohydrolase
MDTTPTRGQQHSESDARHRRCLPAGADVLPQGGVRFRVWASKRQCVRVVLEGGPGHPPGAALVEVALEPEGTGYFSGLVADAAAGTLYRYRLDDEAELYADPASRFQPEGPHGPSQVIDPHTFPWHDQHWCGVPLEGQVLYEMHVGTFTQGAPGRRPAGSCRPWERLA